MKLYIYEHCPFCVRAEMVAALKKLPVEVINLAYDDEKTHLRLAGKKMVPIFIKDNGESMLESLDICHFLDHYDQKPILKEAKLKGEFLDLLKELELKAKYLSYPRVIYHPMNHPVFPTESAINYFKLPKEKKMGIDFDETLENSNRYVGEVENLLHQITPYFKHSYLSSNEISYDDVLYFPVLRLLTLAEDVIDLPEVIECYLKKVSEITKVKLYYSYDYSLKSS